MIGWSDFDETFREWLLHDCNANFENLSHFQPFWTTACGMVLWIQARLSVRPSQLFSELAHQFFLILCMKLRLKTDPDHFGKKLVWLIFRIFRIFRLKNGWFLKIHDRVIGFRWGNICYMIAMSILKIFENLSHFRPFF